MSTTLHPVRADRVGGDRRRQRRVDPAGQRQDHRVETVLAHVVPDPEDQRPVHLGRIGQPRPEQPGPFNALRPGDLGAPAVSAAASMSMVAVGPDSAGSDSAGSDSADLTAGASPALIVITEPSHRVHRWSAACSPGGAAGRVQVGDDQRLLELAARGPAARAVGGDQDRVARRRSARPARRPCWRRPARHWPRAPIRTHQVEPHVVLGRARRGRRSAPGAAPLPARRQTATGPAVLPQVLADRDGDLDAFAILGRQPEHRQRVPGNEVAGTRRTPRSSAG